MFVLTQDFETHKQSLITTALEFAHNTVPSCRERITALLVPFIKDDTVILTHAYSRVVMQVLLTAVKTHRKRISVYVTESRPSEHGYVFLWAPDLACAPTMCCPRRASRARWCLTLPSATSSTRWTCA